MLRAGQLWRHTRGDLRFVVMVLWVIDDSTHSWRADGIRMTVNCMTRLVCDEASSLGVNEHRDMTEAIMGPTWELVSDVD